MRSVAAVKSGALTRMAPLISAFILGFVLFKFTGFISQIPICVLAAILIKIGYDILDLKVIKVLKYAPRDDLYVLLTVLFLTVFYNLIFALGTGIVLAALLYAKRVADNTNIKVNKYMPEAYSEYETRVEQKSHYKIRILHIDGQFFFGSITQIVSHFDKMLETEYIILNYSSNSELDMSAIFALEDIIVRLQSQNIKSKTPRPPLCPAPPGASPPCAPRPRSAQWPGLSGSRPRRRSSPRRQSPSAQIESEARRHF